MSKILIRVQSPDGTKRVEIGKEPLSSLYDKIFKEFKIDNSRRDEWCLYLDRNKAKNIPCSKNTLAMDVISHGDMIYLFQTLSENEMASSRAAYEELKEDDVDVQLEKLDGKISRSRDDQLCNHGPQGKCINCIPIEPFDMEYLQTRDPPVKFMSFHAYLKKLKGGIDKGKYTNLENLNCKIKPGCKEHPPWPKGICNKCQPSTVYLNRQPYRHVDNIMFENGQIVDRFLNFWRKSGHQRAGFLYGRYEAYDGVPLGIRAVVSAIYEPPQTTTPSSIQLHLPDPNEEKVKQIAKKLGLKCVGWIFTDLVMEDPRKGTVKHFRGDAETYFLSADECITAGYFQNIHQNPSRYASEGYFGSKFVTVVVTGDKNNQIHFEGYQISNQCASLVRDKCIVPTYDVPELAYIKESSNDQYIPDVYFREKDKYNNEITKIARPLPVEYLIIDLPAAFAKDPTFTFNDGNPIVKTSFPIENRAEIGEIQDFNALNTYRNQFPPYRFLDAMSDLHLLLFLSTNQTVHFDQALDKIIDAILAKDSQKAIEWSRCPEWLTIEQFFREGSSSTGQTYWACEMCTFENEPATTLCQMCNSPKPK